MERGGREPDDDAVPAGERRHRRPGRLLLLGGQQDRLLNPFNSRTEHSTAQHILGTIATEGDDVFFITVFSVALGRCAVYGRVTF